MSRSPTPTGRPSNTVLESTLRRVVDELFRAKNFEELTVQRVRLATEKSLGLEDEFFKTDRAWNKKSKTIITEAVVCSRRRRILGGYAHSQF